jgi:hypothetical protein
MTASRKDLAALLGLPDSSTKREIDLHRDLGAMDSGLWVMRPIITAVASNIRISILCLPTTKCAQSRSDGEPASDDRRCEACSQVVQRRAARDRRT